MMHPLTNMRLAQILNEERLAEATQRRRIAQARARRKQSRAAVTVAEQPRDRCPGCGQLSCVCRAGPPPAAVDEPRQELTATSV